MLRSSAQLGTVLEGVDSLGISNGVVRKHPWPSLAWAKGKSGQALVGIDPGAYGGIGFDDGTEATTNGATVRRRANEPASAGI